MPEALPDLPYTALCGTNQQSGTPNTGQVQVTFGGQSQFTRYSGQTVADIQIWLGAGRLDNATILPSADMAASGLPIVLYDAAVATPVAVAPGPIAASGHKVVGVLQANGLTSVAMLSGALQQGEVRQFGSVFTSGLCVSQLSGQPGFTINFTPVTSG